MQLNFNFKLSIETQQNYKIGNCFELLQELKDDSIDLIVTDPPYGINYHTGYRNDKNHLFTKVIANDDNLDFLPELIQQLYRVLKMDSAMYMFCNQDNIDIFKINIEKKFNIKNIIVWVKNNWTAGDLEAQLGKQYEFIILANKGRKKFCNDYRFTDVWNFDRVSGNDQIHQNQKPVNLLKQCIEISSYAGDIILDPFMGSGSTLETCKILNRNFIGFEIDPQWETKYKNLLSQKIIG